MIAVDTNIVVRFLVRDDAGQSAAVYRRLRQAEAERESLFVPLLVTIEVIWVLESAYDKSRAEILDALEDLRRMPVFEFERDDIVERLLFEGRTSRVDLSDLLIALSARASGCEAGVTFDKDAAKIPFFRLLN